MDPILRVSNLTKWYPVRTGLLQGVFSQQKYVKAVDNISFQVNEKNIVGLVGESGCGKTTTGKLIARLINPTSGGAYFRGKDIVSLKRGELKQFRRSLQMILQDPYESLNSRKTVCQIVEEPLVIHKTFPDKKERLERVKRALEDVAMVPVEAFLNKYPPQLSGGQRQRVFIARALILDPSFIVADEPVSMLDVSVRGGILNLMLDLRDKRKISYLFITHDLSVAWYVCSHIIVMYLGKIVESGPSDEIISKPMHPYTKALVSVAPTLSMTKQYESVDQVIKSEVVMRSVDLPSGCRFHPRCPYSEKRCEEKEPEFRKVGDRSVACFLVEGAR